MIGRIDLDLQICEEEMLNSYLVATLRGKPLQPTSVEK